MRFEVLGSYTLDQVRVRKGQASVTDDRRAVLLASSRYQPITDDPHYSRVSIPWQPYEQR